MAILKEAYDALKSIVGSRNISEDPTICECYRRGGYGKGRPALEGKAVRPGAVILPGSTEEVQAIVKVCYRYSIPFIPVGTFMISFQAPKISNALTMDLKRMDYFEIDEKNMYATVGPGIIYAQLQAEAIRRGMLTSVPGCGAAATVIANSLNAGMGPLQYRYGWANHRTLAVEWVMPDGELVRLGTAAMSDDYSWGEGLGPDLRGILRGLFGWQGGMGVVTKMATKLFPFPTEALSRIGVSPRTFFELATERIRWVNVFYDDPAKAVQAAHEVSNAEIGASVMTAPFSWRYIARAESREDFWEQWTRDLPKLQKTTPHMMRVLIVGYQNEKQTDYEEQVIHDIVDKLGGEIRPSRNVDESWINNA
ncbi:MAG: FAD-binding protein, partial [Chloroflexota bacterium]|nr:FAD-binding protein [Chloroflexota bacterium]